MSSWSLLAELAIPSDPTVTGADEGAIPVTSTQILANTVLLGVFAVSIVYWSKSLLTCYRSSRYVLVPPLAQEPPFWSPAHFLVMLGVFFINVSLVSAILVQTGYLDLSARTSTVQTVDTPVEDEVESADVAAETNDLPAAPRKSLLVQILANTLAQVISVAITLIFLAGLAKDPLRRLGLTQWSWPQIRVGLLASIVLIPPVLVISGIVSKLVKYNHPVLDSLGSEPTLALFVAMVIGTAVITPFAEEFMFRVLLQGGLQGIADRDRLVQETDEATGEMTTRWVATSWWPIVVTSLLFGMMHYGQGAAPIPLFFLSLGLGYLYRQTGSITPPLVVHAALNLLTLSVHFAQLDQ